MENILSNLSPVQREAVKNTDGPSLIIAGAGSGKTRVLTCKIAYLLMNNTAPKSVLALTFTNKAAREMKERISKVVGQRANGLWMGTFHSVFARILRTEAGAIGFNSNFTIYDTTDSLSIIKEIIKEMNLDDKRYKDREVYNRISMAKNNLITANSYAANVQLINDDVNSRRPRICEIYQKYSHRCEKANAMDFDDLLLNTNLLFKKNPEILSKYQQIFRYILVDEYQDTNLTQYIIVKRLAELHKNITVVGDDAQSIYAFRGARIENILNFKKDYPNYAEFKLEQNYRSTQTIVNAANSVIAKNQMQLRKNCFSKGDIGEKIDVIKAFTDQEEGLLVASSIVETIYSQHADYSGIAILYRTNAQSLIFENSLRKKNIPYRIYGGTSFYQRAEVKDALAYMRLTVNPQDDEALKRVINYPARGIGNTTIDRIQGYATENSLSLWDTISKGTFAAMGIKEAIARKITGFRDLIAPFIKKANVEDAYTFASEIIKKSGIIADLKAIKTPDGVSRVENIEELLNSIKEFSTNAENIENEEKEERTLFIAEYLQNVSLITDADKNSPDDRNKVSLMTIHSAKGLEFDYVYIAGVEEGLFPGSAVQSADELEEERRLFYVALTRAAVKVSVSFAQTRYRWGNLSSAIPSRFLRDIGAQYLSIPLSKDNSTAPNNPQPAVLFKKKDDSGQNFQQCGSAGAEASQGSSASTTEMAPGMEVEHARFGLGRILEIEGFVNDKKALIDFYGAGKKTLLLKFAKLNIISKK
jgi:DNA helicase-2/ATP-dependent DNA helicase PcrA